MRLSSLPLLIVLICSGLNLHSKVITQKDIFVEIGSSKNARFKSMIPALSEVRIIDVRSSRWYEVFENKKSKGFISNDCAKIQETSLVVVKICAVRVKPIKSFPAIFSVKKGKKFQSFVLHTVSENKIDFDGKSSWVASDLLKFIHDSTLESDLFESAPIETIVKLKKEKIYISPYLDKTMYVSTVLGVFISFSGKNWYRIKSLESRKYEISVTQNGWLLADNLVSKDYGRSFTEFFPSYAFPYKDSYVKNIMVSPQGKDAIYLTFSTHSDSNNITLFVLNSIENGWKRIYPTIGGRIISVPVEDTMTSILRFINSKWLRSNRYARRGRLELEDISIQGNGSRRVATLIVKSRSSKKVEDHYVVLSLSYSGNKGWVILDEKWRFI